MPTAGRIEGLDTWRALLMIGGLVLHASLMQQRTVLFDVIGMVSASFRMGAFFAISGLLAGLALRKRGAGAWLARRTFQIGVPTVFTLAILCPIGVAAMFAMPTKAMTSIPVLFDWQHAWFLVALLLYAPMAVALDRIDARGRFRGIGGERQAALRWLVLLGLPLASFGLMSLTVITVADVVPEPYWTSQSQWKFIVGYAPVYAFGFLLARSDALREALLARVAPSAAILGVVTGTFVGWYWGMGATSWGQAHAWIGGVGAVAASALCPPAATILILRSALSMPPMPPIVGRLSDAAFTMYIVHFPLFLLMNLGFAQVSWNPYAEYAVVLVVGGWLAFRIHVDIVCRWRIAALLLNGKPIKSQSSRSGAALAPG